MFSLFFYWSCIPLISLENFFVSSIILHSKDSFSVLDMLYLVFMILSLFLENYSDLGLWSDNELSHLSTWYINKIHCIFHRIKFRKSLVQTMAWWWWCNRRSRRTKANRIPVLSFFAVPRPWIGLRPHPAPWVYFISVVYLMSTKLPDWLIAVDYTRLGVGLALRRM